MDAKTCSFCEHGATVRDVAAFPADTGGAFTFYLCDCWECIRRAAIVCVTLERAGFVPEARAVWPHSNVYSCSRVRVLSSQT